MVYLHLRSRLDHLRSGLVRVLLEVLLEQTTELRDLVLEAGSASPALGRVEELVGDARAGLGDREVEGVVGLVLNLRKLAGVNGVEDGSGVFERAALACKIVSKRVIWNEVDMYIPPVVAPAPTQPVLSSQALALW